MSESTIFRHEEDILGMELKYKIDVPCMVQRSQLWFSASTRLKKILGLELEIKEYREVVNIAFMDAVVRPFGGEHTPRPCMLTPVTRVLHRIHKKWGVNKEKEGWMARGSFQFSSSDGDEEDDESGDE